MISKISDFFPKVYRGTLVVSLLILFINQAFALVVPSGAELYGEIAKGANIIWVTNKLEETLIFKTDYETRRGDSLSNRELKKDGVNLIVNKGSEKSKYFKQKDSEYYVGKNGRNIELIYKGDSYRLRFPNSEKTEEVRFEDGRVVEVRFDWQKPGWDITIYERAAHPALEAMRNIVGIKLFL